MRNFIISISILFFITSCGAPSTLYTWGNKKKYDYHTNSYNYLKVSNEESIKSIKDSYVNIIEQQRGTRKTVPPGIYADYGFLLVSLGEEDKGIEMLKQEMIIYPESTVFISRILKMLNKWE